MKLNKIIASTIVACSLALGLATPVFATDDVATTSDNYPSEIQPTFVIEEPTSDSSLLWIGKNLLFAGNNVMANNTVKGLLFAAGNNLQLKSQSEYAFVAGNTIDFDATIDKDLFVAGNIINIRETAKIGRDVFATGNQVHLYNNLSGDFSVAASRIIMRNATISGNANLDAANIEFEGKVTIQGELSYNDDAEVRGLSNVTYGKLSTYTPTTYKVTAAEIWLSKMISVVSLFVIIAIILLIFPHTKDRIIAETAIHRVGIDFIMGIAFLILVPILAVFFALSVFASPVAIVLLGVYVIMLYISNAFTGAWLGYLLVEKLCHSKLPIFVEALIGILIISCVAMIPSIGALIMLLSVILGLGLVVACIRSRRHVQSSTPNNDTIEPKRVYYAANETATPKSPATKRTPAKKSKSYTSKATKTTKTSKSAKK